MSRQIRIYKSSPFGTNKMIMGITYGSPLLRLAVLSPRSSCFSLQWLNVGNVEVQCLQLRVERDLRTEGIFL